MRRSTHTPVRMCLGCAGRSPQHDLLRLALTGDGGLVLVHGPRHSGRSGYLHRQPDCWIRFAARGGRVRSLGCALEKRARVVLVEELQRTEQSAITVR